MALIKVDEQYTGLYWCCKNNVKQIEKVATKAIAKTKEQGYSLTPDEIEEQMV